MAENVNDASDPQLTFEAPTPSSAGGEMLDDDINTPVDQTNSTNIDHKGKQLNSDEDLSNNTDTATLSQHGNNDAQGDEVEHDAGNHTNPTEVHILFVS